jgi:antitoxin (DNA-binding transcriptional repressor) of toxin-antitoxin stability system
MEASVSDIRRKMKDVMSTIKCGEHVVLSYRNHPFAVIVPLEDEKKGKFKVEDHPAFGMWADREEMADPVTYVEKTRQPRSFDAKPSGREAAKH